MMEEQVMFGLESQIFSIALILFLGVAAAKLTIEQLISLVVLIKKLSRELKGRRLPINIDREIMSGTPVFKGTRVPVDALMNNLAAGVSLGEFLQNFPSVQRDQALAVLNGWTVSTYRHDR
jgi:uncharacterized protein (DUF433 family)